jgi:thioredoxin-dependent peroxiredoxin
LSSRLDPLNTVLRKSAPAFTLESDAGTMVSLKDFKGQTVVLYFYPKDDTSGCTTEACEFRDLFPRFAKGDAVVLGVSPDPVKSHVKFKKKYDLPFTLLADVDHAVAQKYQVWKEKSMYGRKYMGVERTTFVIGTDGKVKHVFEKVKPAGHAKEVADFLASLT